MTIGLRGDSMHNKVTWILKWSGNCHVGLLLLWLDRQTGRSVPVQAAVCRNNTRCNWMSPWQWLKNVISRPDYMLMLTMLGGLRGREGEMATNEHICLFHSLPFRKDVGAWGNQAGLWSPFLPRGTSANTMLLHTWSAGQERQELTRCSLERPSHCHTGIN